MAKKSGTQSGDGKHPSWEVRLNSIRVSVWRNSGDSGEWFNTVITRRYKDGDEWKETNALNGLADLALVLEGGRLALDYIADQHRAMQHEEYAAS